MSDKIKEIFDDFMTKERQRYNFRSLTIWVPKTYKDKYDNMQITTRKELGKKLRELIMAGIDEAESLLK